MTSPRSDERLRLAARQQSIHLHEIVNGAQQADALYLAERDAFFGELGHVDVAFDSVFVEGGLQDFVVLDELVLVLGLPLDSLEGEGVRVEHVYDAAVDGARRALLNLLHSQLHAKP